MFDDECGVVVVSTVPVVVFDAGCSVGVGCGVGLAEGSVGVASTPDWFESETDEQPVSERIVAVPNVVRNVRRVDRCLIFSTLS